MALIIFCLLFCAAVTFFSFLGEVNKGGKQIINYFVVASMQSISRERFGQEIREAEA